MKKMADFIVDKRIPIMIAVLFVTIVCGILIPMVEVNTDMTKYLPDDSAMKQGMDIMNEEFPEIETDKSVRVMFKGLSEEEKSAMKDRLSRIENVSAVDYKAEDEDYNKGEYTKYVIKTKYDYGSPEESAIEATLEADFSEHDMKYKNDSSSRPGLPKWVILTALGLIVLILLIMCGLWLEPFLFLLTIALAIVINLGTNIFMGSIAETTFSIAAILQLILSMDYSIILMNRYRQELKTNEGTDNKAAMKRAIAGAFTSISSSSLTTVVGLLALLFMSFKIGLDMRIVLAKGVFLSVVCVFLVLPGLILLFSKDWKISIAEFLSFLNDNVLTDETDYFALRKALYRTLESTISLHGKHQRAARKALPISCS